MSTETGVKSAVKTAAPSPQAVVAPQATTVGSKIEQMFADFEQQTRTTVKVVQADYTKFVMTVATNFQVGRGLSGDELTDLVQALGDHAGSGRELLARVKVGLDDIESIIVGAGLEGPNELMRKAYLQMRRSTDPDHAPLAQAERYLERIVDQAERAASTARMRYYLRLAEVKSEAQS